MKMMTKGALTLLVSTLGCSSAIADCGGTGQCCQETSALYVCRRVPVSSVTVLTTAPDGSISFGGTKLNLPTFCTTLDAVPNFAISRSRNNYDQLVSLATAAKLAGSVVDASIDAGPGGSCTVGSISTY